MRELLSETRKAAATAQADGKGSVLRAEHLSAEAGQLVAVKAAPAVSRGAVTSAVKPGAPPAPSSADPEREVIAAALASTGNNVSAAAKQLNMHRTQLYRVMRRLGLFAPDADLES